ncbi:MAG: hypothetical protein JO215_15125, partial [Ktedonobacteraceae bacterium]|nr:hypothetical protein [Ktedonobacteraceae bacterium]
MIETLLVGGLAGILTAIVISLLALSIQKRTLNRLQETQYAWERAQETRQQQWQERQEKHLLPLENRLLTSVERLNGQWQDFEAKDAERAENLRRQYELSTT